MSNLFLFQPKQQQQKSGGQSKNLYGTTTTQNSSPFFGGKTSTADALKEDYDEEENEAQYEFGDEEDTLAPLNTEEDFLDDKNDETFGDVGDLDDDYDFSAPVEPLNTKVEQKSEKFAAAQQNIEIPSKLNFYEANSIAIQEEDEEEEEEYPDFDEKDDEEEIVFQVPDESPTKPLDSSPLGKPPVYYSQHQRSPIDRLNNEPKEISADDLEAQFLSTLQLSETASSAEPTVSKPNGIKVLQKPTDKTQQTPTRKTTNTDKQQTPSTPSQKTLNAKVVNQNVAFNTYLSNPFTGYPIFKKVSKSGNLMTGDEIDFILRQQLSDLQVENPVIDDFYFCEYMQKQQNKLAPNTVSWVQESIVQNEEKLNKKDALGTAEAEKPRIFGRLPSQNVRGMRTIVMLDTDELKDILESNNHQSTVNKNDFIHISTLIERGNLWLSQLKDLLISSSGEITLPVLKELLPTKIQDLCESILNTFQITLSNQASVYESKEVIRISQKSKGVKFICKCLSVLPDTYTIPLLENILFNWALLTQTLYGLYNYRRQMMMYMQIPEEEMEGILINPEILFGQLRFTIAERSKRLVNPDHRQHFENVVATL